MLAHNKTTVDPSRVRRPIPTTSPRTPVITPSRSFHAPRRRLGVVEVHRDADFARVRAMISAGSRECDSACSRLRMYALNAARDSHAVRKA